MNSHSFKVSDNAAERTAARNSPKNTDFTFTYRRTGQHSGIKFCESCSPTFTGNISCLRTADWLPLTSVTLTSHVWLVRLPQASEK